MTFQDTCVFCKDLNRLEDQTVFRDDDVLVFVNHEPLKDGHLLVLPVRHAEELGDLEPVEAQKFLQALQACMAMIEKQHSDPPICHINGWKYRSERHLHAHVLPSKRSLRGLFSVSEGVPERVPADSHTLRAMAVRLRPAFEQELRSMS